MSYVKNYNPGQIRMDLPTANYIYELPLLSFGDIYGNISLSMVFNRQMKAEGNNQYNIAAGFKLNLQKKLTVENGKPVRIQDANGNFVDVIGTSSPFSLDDDSQRIIRLSGTTYTLENADMSKEVYDQNGRIAHVCNKYGDIVLAYTYDATGKLTSIEYRGSKRINFSYNASNNLSKITYENAACDISISYVTYGISVAHYSGVTYSITLPTTTFTAQATATENNTTTTHMTTLSHSVANTMEVVDRINGEVVNTTSYAFPENVTSFTRQFAQVEMTNHHGVKVRAYFKENKLLYSHEVGSDDVEFVDNKYPGTIEINGVCIEVVNNYAGRTQRVDSGSPMVLEENENEIHWRIAGEAINITKNGYRCILSGWLKLASSGNSQDEIPLLIEKGSSASHGTVYIPKPAVAGQWTYFVAGFGHEFDELHITISKAYGDIDVKDFRLDLQPSPAASDNSGAEVSYFEDVLIYHGGNKEVYIPILTAQYACGTLDISSCGRVYYDDLLKYKINQRKGWDTQEFYCNHARKVLSINVSTPVTATYNGVPYNLSECYLGKRQYSKNGIVTTRIRDDDNNAFLVYETTDSSGNTLSRNLDEYLDVVANNIDGVTTEYSRDHGLIKTESVENLYTRTTNYGSNTVEKVDEFGNKTTYTLDSVWGVVTSIKLPDGNVVTDTYDDDMCAMNRRTFGSTSGRANALTYSSGNLTRVQTGDLYYNFGYSKGDLTSIQRNGAQIEEHVHTDITTNSYYPSSANPQHSVLSTFDKYGRVTSVADVLENAYHLRTDYDAENQTNAWNTSEQNGSTLLAVSTDKVSGETSSFAYDTQDRLVRKEVTNSANSANKISSEAFTYDNIGRLKAHTDTYDVTNNKSVSSDITYTKNESDVSADNAVKNYTFKVNGVQKSLASNTFDAYKRLQTKQVSMGSKTFTKAFTYTGTRISKIAETVASVNIGTNSYTYDANGRIKTDNYSAARTYGEYKRYGYDIFGQLIREDNEGLAKTFTYSYNNIGNLTSVKEYAYTLSDAPSGDYTEQAYTYSATYPDRLATFAGKTIGYNILGYPVSYNGKSYTWNKGKLARIYCGSTSQPGTLYEDSSFTYNAHGQRVRKYYAYDPNPGSTSDSSYSYNTTYHYDHFGRLIREYCTARYSNGTTTTKEFIYLYDESGMVGVMYSLNGATATRYYYQRNLQGDVIALYDENGTRKVEYAYDAWGNCTVIYGAGLDIAKANPIRYRGYYYDDDTGLYYCNARYYSPKWRRFVSPGKTKAINPCIVNGLNSYVYTNNNPVLVCPQKQVDTHQETYNLPVPALRSKTPKTKNNNPLIFSVGLVTPESVSMPAWMDVYGFYVKGTLGWGYTFGEGYSLVSFGIGVLDATFHLPKLFGFLPDSHLANPNIFLGVGTWNANASVGLGISGTAEILSGTIGIQFGNSVSFGAKGYVGIGFTLDFTNGIRFGVGLGLGFELYLSIDWYELFN